MRRMLRWGLAPLILGLALVALVPSGQAVDLDAPEWVGNLTLANHDLIALSSHESTQEELPGLGHKFELLFAMQDDQDPQNVTNDVISLNSGTPATPAIGVAFRNLPPGIKIAALDHQINLKYFFPNRTCANGGPRIQLGIDTTATVTGTGTRSDMSGMRHSGRDASPGSGTSST